MSKVDPPASPAKRPSKKAPAATYKADNSGGFGNPPVSGQFKPGGKGGPGRPKKEVSLTSELTKMLGSKVALKGSDESVSMAEAIAHLAKKHILSGGQKAIEFGMKLMNDHGAKPLEVVDQPYQMLEDCGDLSDIELGYLVDLLCRSAGHPASITDKRDVIGSGTTYSGICRVSYRDDGHLAFEWLAASVDDLIAPPLETIPLEDVWELDRNYEDEL